MYGAADRFSRGEAHFGVECRRLPAGAASTASLLVIRVEQPRGAPAGQHIVGLADHEEARRIAVVALAEQFFVFGVGVADMRDRGQPDGGRRRQRLQMRRIGVGADLLRVDVGRQRQQRGQRLGDGALALVCRPSGAFRCRALTAVASGTESIEAK